jgi:hypothetical protein
VRGARMSREFDIKHICRDTSESSVWIGARMSRECFISNSLDILAPIRTLLSTSIPTYKFYIKLP